MYVECAFKIFLYILSCIPLLILRPGINLQFSSQSVPLDSVFRLKFFHDEETQFVVKVHFDGTESGSTCDVDALGGTGAIYPQKTKSVSGNTMEVDIKFITVQK